MKRVYARQEAVRVLGISERQLRNWEKQELVVPAETYDLRQLVALRTLKRLRESRVAPRRIKQAIDAVRRKLRDVENPLTDLKLFSDGSRIRVQIGGQIMDSVSGQLLLDFDGGELERMVTFEPRAEDTRREAERKQREAEGWFGKGLDLEQHSGPVDQVINAYKLATALDPHLAAAQVNLGTVYFSQRDWAGAEACYQAAIAINPKYALAHFNLGNLYDERGDQVQALHHYLEALANDPQYPDAHYNLALLYQVKGDLMKAMRHWRTYLKLDPQSAWADIARRELDKLVRSTLVRGKGAGDGHG